MASKGGVYSQTLHDITNTKLEELAKKRATFEQQREQVSVKIQNEKDAIDKLSFLATAMKSCFPVQTSSGRIVRGRSNNARLEIDLSNLDRFLAQARYDPSISPKILEQWEKTLLRHFDVQSLKYTYASLYGQLTTEWLSISQGAQDPALTTGDEDTEMEDFEHVSAGKKVESRAAWEEGVFKVAEADQAAINNLLHDLFESTPDDSRHLVRALRDLRKNVDAFERELAADERHFHVPSLQWTIKGLISSDLLDDEKRAALRDFQGSSVILNEIADVLNMRMAALKDWSWGNEVLLEQRRQISGTFNIYMHEDLLQAIFLQYIGVRWSTFWKHAFASFRKASGVWKDSRATVSHLDRQRRDYYLGAVSRGQNVDLERHRLYRKQYFLFQLLNSWTQELSGEEGDEEAEIEATGYLQCAQAPSGRFKQKVHRGGMQGLRMQTASKSARREAVAEESCMENFDEEVESDEGDHKPKNPMEAKQDILHLLSTEILVKTRLHGELTCFRSQIDNLNPSLPHSTITSVLSFFGVSKEWLTFFDRFLKAPLKFKDDGGLEPRQRRTGTPGSHVLSEVFGEAVLFCLDFQINQATEGELLWRMHDDFWFWSPSHAMCVKAWSVVERFGKIMGLKLNKARTGAARMSRKTGKNEILSLDVGDSLPEGQIRWGMLYLNPDSGRFEIDQKMVDHHINELSRQLKDKTSNIFSWIQAWNSYAATFFTSNFGKPANCFGRQHVDNMLATHERIQRQIFSSSTSVDNPELENSSGSVIEFLKNTIEQRFGTKDIPDGYFYFPTELGGLEVRNPFIGLLQIRDAVYDGPAKLLDEFEESEKEAYKTAKRRFEDWRAGKIHHFHNGIADPDFKPAGKECDTFLSFDEYAKFREQLHYNFDNELVNVYLKLLQKPAQESIESEDSGEVKVAINKLSGRQGLKGITQNWYTMEPYWKWVAQLYGPEMIELFGGLGIVDPSLLPMGMVSLFKGGRVKWGE